MKTPQSSRTCKPSGPRQGRGRTAPRAGPQGCVTKLRASCLQAEGWESGSAPRRDWARGVAAQVARSSSPRWSAPRCAMARGVAAGMPWPAPLRGAGAPRCAMARGVAEEHAGRSPGPACAWARGVAGSGLRIVGAPILVRFGAIGRGAWRWIHSGYGCVGATECASMRLGEGCGGKGKRFMPSKKEFACP